MKKRIKKISPGLLFIAPWLIGFLVLVLWPLMQSFFFSLNNVRIRPTGRAFKFIGFNNYRDIFLKDMFFVQELFGFLMSTLLQVPVIVVFSLILAMLLNQDIKFKGLFRTIFFLPVIISSGPVMAQLIEQGATSIPIVDTTVIAAAISNVMPSWMATPFIGLFSQIIIILWYSGVQILIFLAGLQKIDRSLYEAAKIDGASSWECFWKITLPTLKPLILLNTVYTLVTLANSGENSIINLIYINMFSATRGYGFASAMAWMYAFVILLMLGAVLLIFKDSNLSYTGKKIKKVKGERKQWKMFLKKKKE